MHASTPTAPRTRIKVCGLTREQDVDAAVAAGVDAVGFVLYAPKPARRDTRARGRNWRNALPPFVTPVLLFVNEDCYENDSCIATVWWRPQCCSFMVLNHGRGMPGQPAADGARPYLRAARIPLGDAQGLDVRPRRICV
jgi:phosphoribosylanthranilate isomerase